jgi:hypothetical protein
VEGSISHQPTRIDHISCSGPKQADRTAPKAARPRPCSTRPGAPCSWAARPRWILAQTVECPVLAEHLLCIRLIYANCEEPTSGLEPLTCSLRVISQVSQGLAQACKCRIFRGVSFHCLAECCTVLRSRWCQSGVKRCL